MVFPRRNLPRFTHPLSLALLALALLLPAQLFAAPPPSDFVLLRVQGDGDSVTIEMPLQVLEFIHTHSDRDLNVGRVNGHEARFPMADLLKAVKGGRAASEEVLFFTAKDDDGKIVKFYVKSYSRKPSSSATNRPLKVVFVAKEKGRGETARFSLSLDSVDTFSGHLGSGDKGESDFGPLLRRCLSVAKSMGPGPILRIVGGEGDEVSLFLE